MPHDHHELLAQVRVQMPSDELLGDLSDVFKLFGDSTRMKLLCALSASELCVCALAELLGMEQSAISHQLKKLRAANLVVSRRAGKTVYYRLSDAHIHSLVSVGLEHLREGEGTL